MRRNVLIAVLLGLILRLLVAVWNGFFGPSFGADLDALSFHYQAVEYSRTPTLDEFQIGWIYAYVLGIVYRLTIDSLFLGSLLSCLAWVASAGLLIKIMRLLAVDKAHQFKAMLVYALLPSSVMFTSVTLREPYQLLFVNLAIYSSLEIYYYKSPMYWLVLLCAVLGMGVLHGSLFALGLFIVVATLVLITLRRRKRFSLTKLALVAPLIFGVAFYGLSLFTNFFYNLDDGLHAAVEIYQQGGLNAEGRTNYKDSVEIDGMLSLLLFFPVSIFQYLFEPMPWRISAASDFMALLENMLRAWLIWKAWSSLRKLPPQGRRPVILVLLSYVVVETIWSLGTINWGTALRHHIPSLGLLIAAAFAYSKLGTVPRAKSSAAKPAPMPQ